MKQPGPIVEIPGIRSAVTDLARILQPVFTASNEDAGFFGPGSVAWRIHRDPSYGIGGIASLFHEALQPVAMAAVDQHSDFSHNAWTRTNRTTEYMFTVVFGSRASAEAAAVRVRRIHERIRGLDPWTGKLYAADDPDLLLWVHCVGVDYSIRAYDAYAHRLDDPDKDRFIREMKASARLVGLDEERTPSSTAELRDYLATIPVELSPPAAAFFKAFLKARMPVTMRGVWLVHLVGMVALLPREARQLYEVPRWIPTGRFTRQLIRLLLRVMNVTYPFLRPVRAARAHLDRLENAHRSRRPIT